MARSGVRPLDSALDSALDPALFTDEVEELVVNGSMALEYTRRKKPGPFSAFRSCFCRNFSSFSSCFSCHLKCHLYSAVPFPIDPETDPSSDPPKCDGEEDDDAKSGGADVGPDGLPEEACGKGYGDDRVESFAVVVEADE